MSTESKREGKRARSQPPAAAGLLFLLAGLGSFYGLITVVDPLL